MIIVRHYFRFVTSHPAPILVVVALPALVAGPGIDLIVVDEVGKMECFSTRFVAALESLEDRGRKARSRLRSHRFPSPAVGDDLGDQRGHLADDP